ncbi:MAG TPA: LysR substrate-binding domain-containing protein [Stellaceae bacterium]|nr:LysR substrate-binding domain-containing protein [Stellaceae bacterium]
MRPTFDIDALRAMVVGTELKSFARAAAQLGRSQSAVSMQLKKLEEQSGRPLFRRDGRGLVPTEAGDALLAYARRIIALHDEAAACLGAAAEPASVRMGLPQDLFDDVMPDAIERFARRRPGVHVEVRAGRNHMIEEELRAGRLDTAVAFFPAGVDRPGTRLVSLPMRWLGAKNFRPGAPPQPIPLVLFDHPCLFRQAGLRTLDAKGLRWRLALTTPSLPGIWAALRSGQGITVRTMHRLPPGIGDVGRDLALPPLPAIELRLMTASELSPAAAELSDSLRGAVERRVGEGRSKRRAA